MTGSLRSNRDNFYAILNLKDEFGNRKQKSINLHIKDVPGNKRKAEKALRDILTEYEKKHITVYHKDVLFHEYLNVWLDDAKDNLAFNTVEMYSCTIDVHIAPYFKQLNLTLMEVEYCHIKGYYAAKSKTLSVSTLKKHHAIIKQVLRKAVQDGIIETNPANEIRFPKIERFRGSFLTVEEGNHLLEAAKGTPLETAIIFAMMYGLRRSEIAGLKWSAIDLANDLFTVQHTVTKFKTEIAKDSTKNKSSHRVLPLNRDVKAYLLKLRARQAQDKLILGPGYQDTDYICRWPDGRAMKCDYVSRTFKRFLIKNDLPLIRFHDLRHSCASYMIKMGRSMKEVADWLGHSDISTSMNIYAHIDLDSKKDVAECFNSLLNVEV